MNRTPLRRTSHLKRNTPLKSHGLKPIPASVRREVIARDGALSILSGRPFDDLAHIWISRGASGPAEPWNLACLARDEHEATHEDPDERKRFLVAAIRHGIIPPKGTPLKVPADIRRALEIAWG